MNARTLRYLDAATVVLLVLIGAACVAFAWRLS